MKTLNKKTVFALIILTAIFSAFLLAESRFSSRNHRVKMERSSRAVPDLIDYQGKLTDSDGNPIEGTVSITFSIYDVEIGGAALWTETQNAVEVSDGLFHILLGSETAFPEDLFNESSLWIGINVDGDGEMTPRCRIASVPFAIQSGTSAPDDDWTIDGDNVYRETGNVGIGNNDPEYPLDIVGYVTVEPYEGSGSYARFSSASFKSQLLFHDGTAYTIAIKSSGDTYFNGGDVGIGVTNPSSKLEVNGTVTATAFSGDGSALTNIQADDAATLDGIDSGSFLRSDEIDYATERIIFTKTPISGAVSAGPIYVNPDSAGSNSTLLGVAVDHVQKFRIDAEGDISLEKDSEFLVTGSGAGSLDFGAAFSPFTLNMNAETINLGDTGDDEVIVAGTMTATAFSGDGSALTNIQADDAATLDGIDSGSFLRSDEIDYATERIIFTKTPISGAVSAGPIYVNPDSAGSNSTLLGVAVDHVQKFRIDAEGDISLEKDSEFLVTGSGAGSLDFDAAFSPFTLNMNAETINLGDTSDDYVEVAGDVNVQGESILDGEVGIGTSSPNSKLHINGNGTDPSLRVQVSGSSKLTVAANGGTTIGTYQDTPPTNGLYVAGDVGIGTNNPGVELDVSGVTRVQGSNWPTTGEGMELAYSGTHNRGYIQVYDRDAASWGNLFLGHGSVGIGTTSPERKLTVSGGNDSVGVLIEADVDNAGGESDHPTLTFSQDGGSVQGKLGFYDAYGSNDFTLINSYSGGNLNLGAGGDIALEISNNHDFFLKNSDGDNTIQFETSEDGSDGSQLIMYDSNGDGTVVLDTESNIGSYMDFYTNNYVRTVRIQSTETADGSDGSQIQLYKADGTASITLDAEWGGAGGDGRIFTEVLEITGGSDIAEPFDIKDTRTIKPGMVLSIDTENPGKLKLADDAYDRCVAGIVSGAGGINAGMIMGQKKSVADGEYPVALSGRVYCYADASKGAIQPGDLLTTSEVSGYAMKVSDHTKALGAIIGKAMSSLEKGKGLVLVLVSLQ